MQSVDQVNHRGERRLFASLTFFSGHKERLKFLVITLIPVLILVVFVALAIYSFLLLRQDEINLRQFNKGVVQQRADLADFQTDAQETIAQLYELTSTAGNENDPAKVKELKAQTLALFQKLSSNDEILKKELSATRLTDYKMKSFDVAMTDYVKSAAAVTDMVLSDAATAMGRMTKTRQCYVRLDALMDSMREDLSNQKDEDLAAVTQSMTEGRYIFSFIIAAVSLAVVLLSLLLRRFIKTIDSLNASMTAMLDNLGQGLFFFDAHGTCAPVYSKACLKLLEGSPANKNIVDVLKLSPEDRSNFQTALRLLFSDKLVLGFKEWVSFAPISFVHNANLSIHLAYQPVMAANDVLKGILVIATDRTREEKIEHVLRQNEAAALQTIRISRNRNHFIRFAKDLRRYLAVPLDPSLVESAEQFRRDIHTLKGTADTFCLTELTHELHALEEDIRESGSDLELAVAQHRQELAMAFEKGFQAARQILGDELESQGEIYKITGRQLYGFLEKLQSTLPPSALNDQLCQIYVRDLISVPIWSLLDDFAMSLEDLGNRFGKILYPCFFIGDNFPVLTSVYGALFYSFIHIARNIIDHGIEYESVRVQHGKDRKAKVFVRTETFLKDGQDWILIECVDDGGGIDVAELRKSLSQKNLAANLSRVDDQAILQTILDRDMPVNNEATLMSGRGIGLNAVKNEVSKLGGTITLFSKLHHGVTLRIQIPYIKKVMPERPVVAM